MNALLYIRVSHDDQVKYGESIEAQEHDLTKYCRENSINIKNIYKDEGISGYKLNQRLGFKKMIEDATSGDIILFTKLDRFSRNILDANLVVRELNKKNVSIKAIYEDDIDTSTADGKFMFDLKLSLAERERSKTSERIKDVFAYKKAKGEVVTGATPIGYKIENKHYVLDPSRVDEIHFIFDTYEETNSLKETLRRYHKQYNNNKCSKTVTRILEDTIYYGSRYGNDSFAPAIITKEQFDRVQAKRKHNVRESGAKSIYYFSGLIKCPVCGARMSAGSTKQYKYYRCPNHHEHIRCSYSKVVSESKIEEALINDIKSFASEKKYEISNSKRKDYSKDILKLRNKIDRTKELYIDGDIDKTSYSTKISQFKAQIKEYEELSKTHEKASYDKILSLNIREMYDKLNDLGKRSFWHQLIEEIVIDEERNIIDIKFG